MSVETPSVRESDRRGRIAVNVEFQGSLVARLGTRKARVTAPVGSSLKDVIEAWAEADGARIKYGLLDGDRLRRDTKATRITDGKREPMSVSHRVASDDTIRFEYRE